MSQLEDLTRRALRHAAFTDDGRGGNPAGGLLDTADLRDADRLAVAVQLGYSATAFVEPQEQAGAYRVRYFSPKAEVAFCGHATIATAVALAERDGPGLLEFSTVAGPIPVRTTANSGEITATLTSVPTHPANPVRLAAASARIEELWSPRAG